MKRISTQVSPSGKYFYMLLCILMPAFSPLFADNHPAPFMAPCGDLFFSEYIEGSTGNNKAVEIYNPTNAPIVLTGNYQVRIYANGSASAGSTINLTGTIAAYGVFVLANSGANATITGLSNQLSGSLSFNGDDAVELYKSSASTTVDVIGQIGFDPGTEWGTGLISTADNDIRRKVTVNMGDTNGADVFVPSAEWDGFTDTQLDLGSYTNNCSIVCPAISATITGAGVFCTSGSTVTGATPLSVTISGGTGPYTVVYTDGITNYTALNYASGAPITLPLGASTTFTLVSVTDANSCPAATLSGSAVFAVSTPISATISGAGGYCAEGNTADGNPDLSVSISGGTGPYTVVYTDGFSNYTASNYTSGATISRALFFTSTFTLVSVTDANNCPAATLSGSATFFVSTTDPEITVSSSTDPTTCGGTDGTITITTISGGMGPYTLTWSTMDGSGIVQGAFTQSALSAGTYEVTIEDANGCSGLGSFFFELEDPIGCTVCDITSVSFVNVSVCNDNGTQDPLDDFFTADVVVTFVNPPATGFLQIEPGGDAIGTYSVAVGSLVGTTYTFTGVQFKADGTTTVAEVEFTDPANTCVQTQVGPTVASCSPVCDITGVSFTNVGVCNDNGTTISTDDYFTADVVVNFVNPPATGFLQIEPGGDAIGTYSVAVGSLVGTTYTFTGVQFKADGTSTVAEVEFTVPANTCVQTQVGPTVASCSFVCPSFGGGSNAVFVCSGGNFSLSVTGLSNMAQIANGEADFGITFVEFPAAVADPYTAPNGTILGSVPFASLGGGGTSATLTVTNTTLSVGDHVVYAILTPTPANVVCRPNFPFTFQVVPAVTPFNVTGGGSVCENGGTLPIGLSDSEVGITYSLILNNSTVTTAAGTNAAISFGNFSTPGTYTVVGSDNSGASCTATMNGNAVIMALPESPVPPVTTPVVYCQNDPAVPLTAGGVNLLWYDSPADVTGDPVAPTPSTATVGSTSYFVSQTTSGAAAVSTLAPGDMAIVAFDETTDVFAFVPFVNLAPGTVIYFTDNGWVSGGYRSASDIDGDGGEQLTKYTAPALIPAGTVIYSNSADFAVSGVIPGVTASGALEQFSALAIANAGDQVSAFQNTNPNNPLFNVATITNLFTLDNTGGFESMSSSNNSEVPAGLTAGVTANTFSFDAIALVNGGGQLTASEWLAYMSDIMNYAPGSPAISNLNVTLGGSALCESDRAEIVVTINAPATATIPAVAPVCVNTPINLSVTLGGSAQSGAGAWTASIAGGTFAPDNTANNVIYTPPANFSGMITFSYTTNDPAGPCPAAVATRIVEVQTGGVDAGPDQTICSGTAVSLTGVLSAGATSPVMWSASVAGGTFENTGSLLTTYTPPVGFTGTITLTLSATSTGACANPQDQLVLNVNPSPAAPQVTSPVVYCQNAPAVPLTATGNDLLWYTSPADLTGDPVAPTPSTAVVGNTSYFVTQTANVTPPVSVLAPGDLAIIAFKDGPDNFAFVPFVNLAAGTVIYFTDNGWTGTGFRGVTATVGRGNEDIMRYTVPAGGLMAGTVVVMNNGTTLAPGFDAAGTPIPGTNGNGNNQFQVLQFNATNGDQIYAFQNTDANNPLFNVATQTHLFVYDETGDFEVASSASTGDVPPGLTEGASANTFNFLTFNTSQLVNDGMQRTPAQWLAYLANAANYTNSTDEATAISIADLNLPGACESPRAEIVVTVNPSPAIFDVTGGGEVCTTDNIGVAVGLSDSETGVNYQLLLDGSPVGAPVAGTGNAISFGPQLAIGTYTVTATAVQGNCTAPMNGTALVTNFNCNIVISDPCICLNNATTLTNGQFGEQLKVNAPGTQTWTVTAINGLFNQFSANPPSTPTPIPVGTVLVNIGGNMFTLDGRHIDAIGYTITVSNGLGTSLSIGNSCQYPNPAITSDLTGPFCLYSDIVALTGTPGDANIVSQGFTINGVPATEFDPGAGVGTYVITYTVNGGVPKAAGPNDPGCIQSVSQTVQVVATPANLACNDLVTVSLEADCSTEITPDMILEGSFPCFDDYTVSIDRILPLGNGPWVPATLNEADINQTYAVRVTHLVSGNSCWGYLKVEDKIAPTLTCQNFDLPCNIPSDEPEYLFFNFFTGANQALVYPAVVECDGYTSVFKDTEVEEPCTSAYTKILTRTWTVTDASGNQSTCSQTIRFIRPTLDDVVLPSSYDGESAPFFSCGGVYPTPEWINGLGLQGNPTVFGEDNGCNIGWTYVDEPILVCDGTYKIRRIWTILDWCTLDNFQYVQLIKVVDEAGPDIDIPADLTVSTNPSQCCATVNLPDALITDNCSRVNSIQAMITVYEQYPTGQNGEALVIATYTLTASNPPVTGQFTLGTFPNNNLWDRDTMGYFGTTPCLPIGRHLVTYMAEDNCGNTTAETFWLTVVDDVPPVATCTQFTTVAIGTDDPTDCYEPGSDNDFAGVTWVPASAFNQGSHDNCNPIEFTIRRMQNNFSYGECIDGLGQLCNGEEYLLATAESDSIKFYCCEIGTTQSVILRVYQLDINGERDFYRNPNGSPVLSPSGIIQYIYNECMINVEVQDKIKPTCVPPANVTISCENFDPTLWAYGFAESTDNCCLDTVTVTNNYTQFDTTCNRGTILRTFRAYDCSDLEASCTQRITVTYSQNYFLRLPDDKTVYTCNGTPNGFGYPAFYGDDCELLGVSYNDVIFTIVPDACYKIERTWTIINWCTYLPDQPCIEVPNPNPSFIVNDPANVRAPILSPPGTPAPWAPTVIKINPTDPAPTNYGALWDPNANCYRYKQIIKVLDVQDPVFDSCAVGPVDLCDITGNDPALWNFDYWWDNTLQTHDLCEGPADLSVTALDSCSGTDIRFRYLLFLDLDNDGEMESVVSSANPPAPGTIHYNNINTLNYQGGEVREFQTGVPPNQRSRFTVLENYTPDATQLVGRLRFNTTQAPNVYTIPQLPHGRHKIKWIVEDKCGNESFCEYEFVVRDCKAPVVACADININLMVGGMATLWANDFFLYGEDNCTPDNILVQSLAIIRADENPGNTYPGGVPQNQSVVVTCLDEGQDVPVQVWLQDAAQPGNADFCLAYVNVQANVVGCENFSPAAAVAGAITANAQGVEQANVELSGTPNVNMAYSTSDNGNFHFASVPLGANVTVTPTKDDNPLNGVSTFDLVLISKHILGLEPLNTPYKLIAADANRSGSITSFDIVEFRKLILGVYNELPNNTSWRFVDKAYQFPQPANPFQPAFPENISLENIAGNMMNNHFEGVKVGDVNGTALANSLQSLEDRSAATLLFDVEDRTLQAGEVFTLNFKGAERVEGYQFTMNFAGLEVLDVVPGAHMSMENFGVFAEAITTSVDGEANEFAVTFRATKAGRVSQMLTVSSRITKAEAYLLNERMDVAFRFNNGTTSSISGVGFELYQNQPNPFVNKTFIGFHLPEATAATLRIFDETGRMVFTQNGDFAKGYNTISVDRALLNTVGVLYYTLETATDSATKKMIQSK